MEGSVLRCFQSRAARTRRREADAHVLGTEQRPPVAESASAATWTWPRTDDLDHGAIKVVAQGSHEAGLCVFMT